MVIVIVDMLSIEEASDWGAYFVYDVAIVVVWCGGLNKPRRVAVESRENVIASMTTRNYSKWLLTNSAS